MINDGDVQTDTSKRWVGKTPPLPHTIEFTWDKPQTIGAARILTGWAHDGGVTDPLTDFVLQYQDGKAWKDIPGAKVENNENPNWLTKFTSITSSKMRLVITATPGNISRLWEVELYAPK